MLISEEEYMVLRAKTGKGRSVTTQAVSPKPAKYHNKKVRVDGYTFDSKIEWERYIQLQCLVYAGQIEALQVHPVYSLDIGESHICNYEADFAYVEDGKRVVEDVKGIATPVYRLKSKLLCALYGIRVKEVRKK